ncbi:cytochrome P450 2J4-like [Ciona intestinalis]
MYDVIIVCVISAIAVVAASWVKQKGSKKFPPGSRGLPFFGSVPFVLGSLERTLAVWGWQNYGPVFFFTRGNTRTVVLNTYEAASEGFVKQGNHLSGRFTDANHNELFADYSPQWQEQRKLRVKTLKGFGKVNTDEIMTSECMKMICRIRETKTSFEAGYYLAVPTFNIVKSIIYGEPSEGMNKQDEVNLSKILADPVYRADNGFMGYMAGMFPQIRSSVAYERMLEKKGKERVQQVKEKMTGSKKLIEGMLQNLQDWETGEVYNNQQLSCYLTDLFMAGTDTMATTVHWSLVFLAQKPQVQEKMAAEVKSVAGNDVITTSMMDSMPYTRAVMHESSRLRPVFPLSLRHQATSDVTVKDYVIPTGTSVVANLWAIQNDPKWWKQPSEFRPERHVTEDGGFTKSEKIVPFSIGPRYCLGSQIAIYQQFIFLTNLVRAFRFRFDQDKVEPDLTGLMTSVLAPVNVHLVAEER